MRRGFILILVLGLLGILALVAVNFVSISSQTLDLSQSYINRVRVQLIAQSGFEMEIDNILHAGSTLDLSGPQKIGQGTYQDGGDTAEFKSSDLNGRININDGIRAGELEFGAFYEASAPDPYYWKYSNVNYPSATQSIVMYSAYINQRVRRLLNAYGDVHRFVDKSYERNERNCSEPSFYNKALPTPVYSTRIPRNYNWLTPSLNATGTTPAVPSNYEDTNGKGAAYLIDFGFSQTAIDGQYDKSDEGSPDGTRLAPMSADQDLEIGERYNNGLGDRILLNRPEGGYGSLIEIENIVNTWSKDPGIELSAEYLNGEDFFELVKNDLTVLSYEDDSFFRLNNESVTFDYVTSFLDSSSDPPNIFKLHGNVKRENDDGDWPLKNYKSNKFPQWRNHSVALINLNKASFFVRAATFYAPTNVTYSTHTARTIAPYYSGESPNYGNDFFDEFTAYESATAAPELGVTSPVFAFGKELLENGDPSAGRRSHLMSLRDAMHLANQYDEYLNNHLLSGIINFDDFKEFLQWHENNSTVEFPSYEKAHVNAYSKMPLDGMNFNAGGLFHISEFQDSQGFDDPPGYGEFSQDYVSKTLPHLLSCVRRIPSYLGAPMALQSPYIVLKPAPEVVYKGVFNPAPTEQPLRSVEDFVWRFTHPKVCFLPLGYFELISKSILRDPKGNSISTFEKVGFFKLYETEFIRSQKDFLDITDPTTDDSILIGPEHVEFPVAYQYEKTYEEISSIKNIIENNIFFEEYSVTLQENLDTFLTLSNGNPQAFLGFLQNGLKKDLIVLKVKFNDDLMGQEGIGSSLKELLDVVEELEGLLIKVFEDFSAMNDLIASHEDQIHSGIISLKKSIDQSVNTYQALSQSEIDYFSKTVLPSKYIGFVGLKDFDEDIGLFDTISNFNPQIVMNFDSKIDTGLTNTSVNTLVAPQPQNPSLMDSNNNLSVDPWINALEANGVGALDLNDSQMEGSDVSFFNSSDTTNISPFNGCNFLSMGNNTPGSFESTNDSLYWRLNDWLDISKPMASNLTAGVTTFWFRMPSGYDIPSTIPVRDLTGIFPFTYDLYPVTPLSYSRVFVSLNFWESFTDDTPTPTMVRPVAIHIGLKKTPSRGLNIFARYDSGGPSFNTTDSSYPYIAPPEFDVSLFPPSEKFPLNGSDQYDYLGFLCQSAIPAEDNLYSTWRSGAYRSSEVSVKFKSVPEAGPGSWHRVSAGWNLGWSDQESIFPGVQLWIHLHNKSVQDGDFEIHESYLPGDYLVDPLTTNPLILDQVDHYPGGDPNFPLEAGGLGFMLPFDPAMVLSLGEAQSLPLTGGGVSFLAPAVPYLEGVYTSTWRLNSTIDNFRFWMGSSNPDDPLIPSEHLDPFSNVYSAENNLMAMRYHVSRKTWHPDLPENEPIWIINPQIPLNSELVSVGTRVYYPADSNKNTPYVKLSLSNSMGEIKHNGKISKNEQDIFYSYAYMNANDPLKISLQYQAHKPKLNGDQNDIGDPLVYKNLDHVTNIPWIKEISYRYVPPDYPRVFVFDIEK